jgi:hypothetical protein
VYVVYVRERYNISSRFTFKKCIDNFEVKVDVQKGP